MLRQITPASQTVRQICQMWVCQWITRFVCRICDCITASSISLLCACECLALHDRLHENRLHCAISMHVHAKQGMHAILSRARHVVGCAEGKHSTAQHSTAWLGPCRTMLFAWPRGLTTVGIERLTTCYFHRLAVKQYFLVAIVSTAHHSLCSTVHFDCFVSTAHQSTASLLPRI